MASKKKQGQSRGKKGDKKHGRKADVCARYRLRSTRERNKLRRLARHWHRQPGDRPAVMSTVDKILDEHWGLNQAWVKLVGEDWRGQVR